MKHESSVKLRRWDEAMIRKEVGREQKEREADSELDNLS